MNRLADAMSPYLQQHRDNPVHWWPWGREALAAAKRENKPILLSVGYAACHWCHVMAHESFEDPETAALMNALFVNIKVDREERPDIDQIYMAALHRLGEPGGWPLTMFLDSEARPFWGGTYFPPTSRFGKPAFSAVLRTIAALYRNEPDKIAHNRDAILEALQDAPDAEGAPRFDRAMLDRISFRLLDLVDFVNGGIKGAPKFPQAAFLELLWRAATRTGDPRFADAFHITLRQICLGGIYDHLGGGFARYTVDDRWLVPHFEKMLYDNGQLLTLLAAAYQDRPEPLYRDRIEATIRWLSREMAVDGAYAASLDADSEGHEGRFYVWALDEINAVLGLDQGSEFARTYDVQAAGNWENISILNRLSAAASDPPDPLPVSRETLLNHREKRPRPNRDTKILTDWNAYVIIGLARASRALHEPSYLAQAERLFSSVSESMRDDTGNIAHARAPHAPPDQPGFASDLAALLLAATELYELTWSDIYLKAARSFADQLCDRYARADGRIHFASSAQSDLILRPAPTEDEATPNHHAMAAVAQYRLAALTEDSAWRDAADALLEAAAAPMAANVFAHCGLLNALDTRLAGVEIAIGPDAPALWEIALGADPVSTAIRHSDRVPAGHATVCVGENCSLPINDPAALRAAIIERRAAIT